MRYIPKAYNTFNDLFSNLFQDPFFNQAEKTMKTDITEKDGNYLMNVELPGFNKEEIKIDLKDGYVTVNANHFENNEEKDDKGNVIRQERYTGSMTRSFYVGDGVTKEDIKAKYENGELKLVFPKKEETKEIGCSIDIE